MTSASQRYAARRLAINRGFGRPPDRVAPVVAIADNGQDDSADGIPARIRTGSHHVARRAYHHSNGFDVLFRTVSVVGKNGSVPLRGRRSESVARICRGGGHFATGTDVVSNLLTASDGSLRPIRPPLRYSAIAHNVLIKLATSDSLKCLSSLKIAINAIQIFFTRSSIYNKLKITIASSPEFCITVMLQYIRAQ